MQLDLFGEPVAAPISPDPAVDEYALLDMDNVPFGPVTQLEEKTNVAFLSALPEEFAIARDNFLASTRAETLTKLLEEVQADNAMSVLGHSSRMTFKTEWLPMVLDKMNGMTMVDIAKKYNRTVTTLYGTFNRPSVRRFVAKLLTEYSRDLGDPADRIRFAATEAVDKIITQMRTAQKEETQQKAAFGILRMAGYDNQQKVSLTVDNQPLSAEVVSQTNKLLEALSAANKSREISYGKYVQSAAPQGSEAEYTELVRPVGLKLAAGGG
jgi:hypothetical protein